MVFRPNKIYGLDLNNNNNNIYGHFFCLHYNVIIYLYNYVWKFIRTGNVRLKHFLIEAYILNYTR